MHNIFKVYLIREKSSRKICYAGLTRQTLEKRFEQHVYTKKLQASQYLIELVQDDLTIEQAAILERMVIQQYNLTKDGWNVSPGSSNGYSNYHSEEAKQRWSLMRKGKPVSPEHAAKNRVARLGKTNSEAHKKALSAAVSKSVVCLETGEVFQSARQAAKKLNLQYSKISLVCNGKRTSTGGLHFKFVDETVELDRNVQAQTQE